MHRPPQARHLTPPQVAERLGTSVKKILHWIDMAELAAVNTATRRGGRPRWKISVEALAAFELSRTNLPPAPVPTRKPRRPEARRIIQLV